MIIQTDVYYGLLKMFDSFTGDTIKFKYKFDNYNNIKLRNDYNLFEICGGGSSLEKSINLMKWLFSILIHNPDYINQTTDNSFNLIEKLNNKIAINCRATATILTECLLSVGIPARSVWLMPFSPYDRDCHVVTMAFCKELSKWVMLDATVNSIVMNKDGTPLDPIEIRDIIKDMGTLSFSNELWFYRINCSSETQRKGYYTYLAKNTFYLKSYKFNCFGYENIKNPELVFCIPNGFDYDRQRLLIREYNKNNIIDLDARKILCSKSSFVAAVDF